MEEQIENWEKIGIENVFGEHSKYSYKISSLEELGAMLGFLNEIVAEDGKTNADLLFRYDLTKKKK